MHLKCGILWVHFVKALASAEFAGGREDVDDDEHSGDQNIERVKKMVSENHYR